jgi:hypothetical protein
MKQFIKEMGIIIIVALLLITLVGIIIYESVTTENKSMGAVVLEHNVTANHNGSRTYTTLIKTDDGFIIEKEGLNYYVIPTGSRVTIQVRRTKKASYEN